MTKLDQLKSLLDPDNKDFPNGLQEKIWSLRPIKNPKEKYLVAFPAASHTLLVESDEVAESLNLKLTEQQIKDIEKTIFEDRKKGCVVKIETLKQWVLSNLDPSEAIIAGMLGDSRINLVILSKIISVFVGDSVCIYPPPPKSPEKPFIFEGLGYRAIVAPIYKKSSVKTVLDGFNLILDDMSGGYKEFLKAGGRVRDNIVTPESLWKEYFEPILKGT